MKDFFSNQSNFYKVLGFAISALLMFYSFMNHNPVAVVLSVLVFFVIQMLDVLLDIKDNVHFSNHLMIDIVEGIDDEEYDEDELLDMIERGDWEVKDEEAQTSKPSPVLLDDTDDKTWTELMKYIKKQKDSND